MFNGAVGFLTVNWQAAISAHAQWHNGKMSAKTLSNRPKLNTLKFWTYQDCSKSYELRSQDCTRSGDHSTVATLRLLLLLFCRAAGPKGSPRPPPTGSPGSPPPPFICDGTCSSFWVSLNYISSWNNREDYATCHMCACVKITQKLWTNFDVIYWTCKTKIRLGV